MTLKKVDPQIKDAIENLTTSLKCIAEMQTLPKELQTTVRDTIKFHRNRVQWNLEGLKKAGVLK